MFNSSNSIYYLLRGVGNKFAVTSGAKVVPVCHFEVSNNWWISKMIKKHKSTVLDLAWCVNNKV